MTAVSLPSGPSLSAAVPLRKEEAPAGFLRHVSQNDERHRIELSGALLLLLAVVIVVVISDCDTKPCVPAGNKC